MQGHCKHKDTVLVFHTIDSTELKLKYLLNYSDFSIYYIKVNIPTTEA